MQLIAKAFLLLITFIGLSGGPAAGQAPNSDAIIEQLSRGVKARKIDIEELRNSVKNKIEVEAVKPTSSATSAPSPISDLPTVSFEVFFDYNSAALSPQSIPTLVKLGQALKDDRLSRYKFLIAGHTDAAGGREYNRALSERRADTVRTFLVTTFGIASDRISPIGFGMEQLKDNQNPLSGINRRVEVVNIGQQE
jgi:outer membrane protein OmpA-like peptidoglycan-associated protein